jgi:glycosyltransferase involved in cell wall biosynthesis
VIARDAEHHIRRCLDSLSWVDECIVVVDERSADATSAIARETGATVLRHAYAGNIEQKNFALEQAKGEWVVFLDADEALSADLVRRLRERLAARSLGVDGFELDRVTFHLGRWLRHGDFHPDWQLRVFRRGVGRWSGRNPHGRVRVAGRVERLPGDLEHRSYRDLADQLERIRQFSAIEAREMFAAGRRARIRDMALRPPARWLRAYVQKRGFLDGVPGFLVAVLTAFHVFLKYAQLWELQRGQPPPANEARSEPQPSGASGDGVDF